MYTLEPVDSRKSFYGKCHVLEGGQSPSEEFKGNKGILFLQSYSTIVAEFDKVTGVMTIHGYYSTTTARHINAFLVHCGFPTASKAEIVAWEPHAVDAQ